MRRSLLLLWALLAVPAIARPQGNPLGPEFLVNTTTGGVQDFSSIAADSSGNFVVVWQSDQDGSQFGIFGQRFAGSGPRLGPEFKVNTYTTGDQFYSAVASAPSGNFVVTWTDRLQDGSLGGIFAQRYTSSGSPSGTEFRVNTYTTGHQFYPSVAVDGAGNFIVAWQSYAQDGSSWGVFGQRYASSGMPAGPEFRVNTFTTGHQTHPTTAMDASGDFVVVWQSNDQDASGYGVFGQRYSGSGVPLGPEFRVNTYTTLHQDDPSVAADAGGNFVVVWWSPGQDGCCIFGQRYASSGSPLGSEFRVNTYTVGFTYNPAVAADASGNFVVTWDNALEDGSGYGVFGQRYASLGFPLGSEFRINSHTTNAQFHSAVTANAIGNFVVSWDSLGQVSGGDIFAQRYGQIVPVELMRLTVD